MVFVSAHEGLTDSLEEVTSVCRDGPEGVMNQGKVGYPVGIMCMGHRLAQVGPVQAMHEVWRDARLLLLGVDLLGPFGVRLDRRLQTNVTQKDQVDSARVLYAVLLPHREAIRRDPVDRHDWLEDLDFRVLLGLLGLDFSGQQLG